MTENDNRIKKIFSAADFDYLNSLDLKQINRIFYRRIIRKTAGFILAAAGAAILTTFSVWSGILLIISGICCFCRQDSECPSDIPQWLLRHFRKRKIVEQELEMFSIDDSSRVADTAELSDAQRRRIAVHEAGHAVCVRFLPELQKLKLITIEPDHLSFGRVEWENSPQHIHTETAMRNLVAAYYSGHIAEKIIYGESSIGCELDIESATNIAGNMVRFSGMGKRTGLLAVRNNEFHHDVDSDIQAISRDAEKRCTELLTEKKEYIEALAERLLEMKTIESQEIDRFFSEYIP
jgi:hypothetical protein